MTVDGSEPDTHLPLPAPSLQTPAPNLTGWPLDEAQAYLHSYLQSDEQTKHYQIVEVQTAPPQRRARHVEPTQSVSSASGADSTLHPGGGKQSKRDRPEVHLASWRVVRCRIMHLADGAGQVELLVAREQIAAPIKPAEHS